MPREDGMMAGREAVVASAIPDPGTEGPARAALLIAVAGFARRKPLGALGGLIVLALVLTALLAPLISPYDPRQIIREADNRVPVYVAPGSAYPMGTDHVGRDIVSRIIYGARISLYVGLGAVLIGVTGWFVVGMVSAYAGRGVDLVVQRVVDAMMAVPGLIIVLAIMAVLGSSLNNVIIAIVIGMLAPVVRTVRSQVLSVKEMEYVVAARAIGARSMRVVLRHIMPNCLAIYLILATYYLGFAIILEASLSFLGVGVPPDVPSWGGMLTAAAQGHITKAPWAGIFPGLAIFIVVLGFNLLGDALRDVLEPRLRGARLGARLTR
jgi:peptide/nickel transport system permease protein